MIAIVHVMRAAESGTSLTGQRLVLTGATGFIGGHAAEALHLAGADVHGLTRSSSPSTTLGTPVTWHQVDLTDQGSTLEAIGDIEPTQIVHLASLVKGARDPDLIMPMFLANAASTVYLLEAAKRFGVGRVLLAGSLEEPSGPGEVASSPYAASKAVSHIYGDYYDHATDVEVVNLQIFMVYGPAQVDELKLVPYVVNTLLAGQAPEIGSGGRPVDWVYVKDVAEGIVRCCTVERAPNQPVPLGTGELTTVKGVVDELVALADNASPANYGTLQDRADEVIRRADTALTEQLLGWHPATSLSEGLAATLEWYRQRHQG